MSHPQGSHTQVPSLELQPAMRQGVLDETLRCLATVTRARSVALLEVGGTRGPVASSGPTPSDLGLRIASTVLRMREPLWIDDATTGATEVRSRTAMSVALLPVRGGAGRTPCALVVVRDAGGSWSADLQATIEAFVPLMEAALPASSDSGVAPADAAQFLVDSLSDLAWMKDTRLRFVAVNQPLARLLERAPAEMLGKTDLDFFPQAVAEAYRRDDVYVLQEGRPCSIMEQLADGAGVPHWIETTKTPVFDEHGTIIGISGVARDVTVRLELENERRRLMDELAQERDRWQDLITNVPGVVWEERFDGSYRFVSEQVEELLGYTTDEYAQTVGSFMDLVHEDDLEEVLLSNAAIVASGEGGSHSFRMRRKDGSYVWCESHCRVIKDASGQVIGLRGVSIDISPRKEAEERLRASEERFRDLANVTPVMIFTTDAAGNAEFQNRRMLDFAGMSTDELRGDAWRSWIHPEDRERVLGAWQQAHERRRWLTLEGRYRRHDGEYRDLLVEATPRYAADGSFAGFAATCVDLTDRRRLEHRLEQERQLTSLGRLAATIAHEINNVLMGIQPFAEVIRRTPSATMLDRASSHIMNSVQRGRRITHEILRFTKTSDPVLLPLDVRSWLEQISDELQSVAGPAVKLVIDVDEDMRMLADRHQMTQVLTNLAANARDAMQGNGTLTIAARLERSWPGLPADGGSFVHLSISDTGPGIPAELLDCIFEPLFTTKRTGTGLGLAIVRDVIRRHRGDVLIENGPERGAIFHLVVAGTEEAPAERSHGDTTMPPLLRRILLVEDDEAVALGLAAVLELEDVEVRIVRCGADAVAAIQAFRPDLVTLDIGLPDMPGTIVFRQIRDRWPHLPVVFSTGHAGELETGIEVMGGPTAHLLKPYDLSAFVAAVRRLSGS